MRYLVILCVPFPILYYSTDIPYSANFGREKLWQIWQNKCHLPTFYPSNSRFNTVANVSYCNFTNIFLLWNNQYSKVLPRQHFALYYKLLLVLWYCRNLMNAIDYITFLRFVKLRTKQFEQSPICDWIWEKLPSMHNYKYIEMPFVIIWSVVSQEGKQMLAWNSPLFYSYLYSIYAPTVEWIPSWIACHFR